MPPRVLAAVLCLLAAPSAGLALPSVPVEADIDKLPEDFLVGAGTSSYQCEGAWNEDGKGESAMDYMFHKSGVPAWVANGDVAADSYHRYKEDVAVARDLGLQMYRFSLSWPRLLPTGHVDHVNAAGLRYYNHLLDELLQSGIQPMVTLFHFDFPQALMTEFRGWESDKMVDAFVNFAEFAFTNFGDRVKHWVTFNEPFLFCAFMQAAFSNGSIVFSSFETKGSARAPEPGREGLDYDCLHRNILAHAKTYALYKAKFAAIQKGFIGLTNIGFAPQPNSTSYEDVAAARRHNLFTMGTTFGPLATGQYPAEVRHAVDEASRAEGLARSRLPNITADESALLKGTIDFLGLNLYYGQVVAAAKRPERGTMLTDSAVNILDNDITDPTHNPLKSFSQMTPWSLREAALWLWDEYRLPIFITENGYVMKSDEQPLDDNARAVYHSAYMRELLRAVHEDGVRVLGYLAWSLIDVYEFISQYKYSFGLVHVDYAGGSLNRTLKRSSSAFFRELTAKRRVPVVELRSSATAATACTSTALALVALAVWAAQVVHGR